MLAAALAVVACSLCLWCAGAHGTDSNGDGPTIYSDESGSLVLQSASDNGSVLVNNVDILQALSSLQEEIGTLKSDLSQQRRRFAQLEQTAVASLLSNDTTSLRAHVCASLAMLHIGTLDHYIYSIDADGSVAWTYQTSGLMYSNGAADRHGNYYVGSLDGNLYAFNTDGTLRWQFNTNGAIYSSILLVPDATGDRGGLGLLYFGSRGDGIFCVDTSGTLVWRSVASTDIDEELALSPLPGDSRVCACGLGTDVYCFDRFNGSTLWTFRTGSSTDTPVIGNDGTIYFGAMNGFFFAIHKNGTERWRHPVFGGVQAKAVLSRDGDRVYFGGIDGYLYALEASSGALIWRFATFGPVYCAPTFAPNSGTIYFTSFDAKLYALEASSGDLRWAFEGDDASRSAPAVTPDGVVYFGTNAGTFYAIYPDGTEKWSIPVRGDIDTSPIVNYRGVCS